MSYLYLTADKVGAASGGGKVTQEESTALFDLAVECGEECQIWGRDELTILPPGDDEPWRWDLTAALKLPLPSDIYFECMKYPKLAHVYAGTFTKTIELLKRHNCKVSYTAAAHDVFASHTEHLKLGLDFNYPHLTDPNLWHRYVSGYRQADVVICPSQHSAECMKKYGCERIEIIPHGVDIPEEVTEPARLKNKYIQRFVVGYLGAVGPDKGLIYLLQAWKKLDWRDGLLALAGRDSQSDFVRSLIDAVGINHDRILCMGWLDHSRDLYNSIDLYIQPSVTEGFGIEVLEAMAHGRAVLCSDGAGAADVVPDTWRFPAANADALAEKIDQFRKANLGLMGRVGRELAKAYEWRHIRKQYQEVWKTLLSC